MPRPTSPAPLRRLALASIVANVAIVLTGGVVRLTGSGLGCPDWPTCEGSSVLPSPGGEAGWHQAIEFGNRVLAAVVLAIAVAVLVAAWRRRPLAPGVWSLSVALPAGVLAQAVLGGITVLTDLNPLVVAAHFLLSMVVIAVAVALHDRLRVAPGAQGPPALRRLATVLVAVAAVVLTLGTLVTAAGPHAGDPGTPRIGLDIRTVALAHASAVWLLVGLTVAMVVVAVAVDAGRTRTAAITLLAIELAQGAVGYAQYALGVPAALVAVHLVGASLLWVTVIVTHQATRRPEPGPPHVAPTPPVGATARAS